MTIRQWLADPSDFNTGKDLYDKYGRNAHLKKQFASGRLPGKLVYELGKLVGVDEREEEKELIFIPTSEFKTGKVNVVVDIADIETFQNFQIDHSENKPLFDERSMLHHQLEVMDSDEKRLEAAERIEEITDTLDQVYNPVKKEEVIVEAPAAPANDVDKMKRLQNLKTYISKHKNNKRRADDVEKWQLEKAELEKELNEKA